MALLRAFWQGLVLFFEAALAWLIRPRIIALILFAVVLGGLTYYFYGHPTIGLAIKQFVLKTLPKWGNAIALYVAKLGPKLSMLASRALKKKYLRGLILFLTTIVFTKRFRKAVGNKKDAAVAWAKRNLYERPRDWWIAARRETKILVVALIIVIVISVPSLHMLGLMLIPLTIVKSIAHFIWTRFLVKIGMGAVINAIHVKVARLLAFFVPSHFTKYKWKMMRKIVSQRRKLHKKAGDIAQKGKDLHAEYKERKALKGSSGDKTILVQPEEIE